MGKIEIRLNRKMTADDVKYVHKWMGEYRFGMEIIDQAFMQSWGYGYSNNKSDIGTRNKLVIYKFFE